MNWMITTPAAIRVSRPSTSTVRWRDRTVDRRLIVSRSEGEGGDWIAEVLSGRPKGDGREIGSEASFVGCREWPTHDLSMGTDEEIGQR